MPWEVWRGASLNHPHSRGEPTHSVNRGIFRYWERRCAMYLLYGVVFLSAAVLLCGVTLLGARNPIRPFWASEELIANLHTPLMIGLFILGIMNIVQFITLMTLPSLI